MYDRLELQLQQNDLADGIERKRKENSLIQIIKASIVE